MYMLMMVFYSVN